MKKLLALLSMVALGCALLPSAQADTLFTVTPGAGLSAQGNGIVATAGAPTLLTAITANYQKAFDSWNASLAAANRWTLSYSAGGLSNTSKLFVDQYQAYVEGSTGGVEIDIQYTPGGAGDPPAITAASGVPTNTQAAWTQSIFTTDKRNPSLPGNPYLDNAPGTLGSQAGPPLYPFQYQGSMFYDKPGRGATNTWQADAYLSTANYTTRQLTLYNGVAWGFTVGSAPEPPPLAALGFTGLGALGLVLRARRRRGVTAAA